MTVIGLIGGSGIYSAELLSEAKQVKSYTPYGAPSAALTIGRVGVHRVVFLPRHGAGHSIPPHMINYRANIWALREQDVERVLAPSAVGSLQEEYRPGELVLPDQFIDRTYGRPSTFYDGGQVAHISMADPFCPELTDIVYDEALKLRLPIHKGGTYVCIQGPRFSTRAESHMFRAWGGHIIGMTLVPEVSLAREARMCYLTIAMVTDYDCWKEGWRVTAEEVVRTMASNVEKVQRLLARVIPAIPETRSCRCGHYLDEALL
ncbi:MAG: S-methyl-5'-thioadenosine phosphorylase [Nitrososphaerota archaeon]|nr:S-methyl-5'-thioadenosine phosphorylase [Candidatus Calditenuaceae archaeon]MDW8073934.1 S-methyl-5'-thioadenosine phosphorylase [Nitrososphaerota archaeon]